MIMARRIRCVRRSAIGSCQKSKAVMLTQRTMAMVVSRAVRMGRDCQGIRNWMHQMVMAAVIITSMS